VKFLCLECDSVMTFAERRVPGDGTLAAVFACGTCGREMAMLTNPMETQLVSSMGVKIGGRTVPEQPMEIVRSTLGDARDDAFDADGPSHSAAAAAAPADPADRATAAPGARPRVTWGDDAVERLERVPSFVRGMVKRIYTDWARERGIERITVEVMDTARSDLGLEGM
jgi:hypothetical protein